jgi:anion-transporting  ArsA/GET3 family ATPase
LSDSRVIVCAGSGGVGKTTVSAALGARAARGGRRVLALTVDPARRLAMALGLDPADDGERRVALPRARGELSAAVIDSKKTFDAFVARHATDPGAAERILRNRLYKQLSTTLSGSQEFTSLERLLQAIESGRYDLVVLDTPPTKHAVDFLTAPQRIEALFQESITRWFMAPGEGAGILAAIVSRGTRVALKSLEALTGGQFIEELTDFFAGVRAVQKTLRERSIQARAVLTDPATRFAVVTSFDAAKLQEARYLQGQLRAMNYNLGAVVINRAFPSWLEADGADPSEGRDEAYEKVRAEFQRFKAYYSSRYGLYDSFARGLDPSVALFRIPEYERDVYGLEDLDRLSRAFEISRGE